VAPPRSQGYAVNRKRVARLMRRMGIEAADAKPKLGQSGEKAARCYPYRLKRLKIARRDQVWCTDITLGSQGPKVSASGGGDGLVQPIFFDLSEPEIGRQPEPPLAIASLLSDGNRRLRSKPAVVNRGLGAYLFFQETTAGGWQPSHPR
jgi:hypothetical protein